jgi:integrase
MPSGDGLFRKQGSPYWYTKLKGADGRWRDISTKCTAYSEAKKIRLQLLASAAEGTAPAQMAKWKLSQAVDEFLKYRRSTKASRTALAEKFRLRALQRVLGPDKRLETVSPADLRLYQVKRLEEGRKPATINSELRCLRLILKAAKVWNRVREDYNELQVPRESPRRALSVAEFNQLVKAAQSNPAWGVTLCVAVLAAQTTARSCEIKNLRLSDVVLTCDAECPTPHLKIRRASTKTNAGVRLLPLNRPATWAIKRLLERAAHLGSSSPEHFLLPADLSRHTKGCDPLCGQSGYDPTRHQDSWRSAWRSLLRACGLNGTHFHDLRHTSITHGRKQGVTMEAMRRLAGHMTVEMTEYYTHLGNEDITEAVNKIEVANPELLDLLEFDPGSGA